MLIKILLKDPDGAYDSIDGAIRMHVSAVDGISANDDAHEALVAARRERADKELRRWLRHGEYVMIEIDTDAKTARVVPTAEWK